MMPLSTRFVSVLFAFASALSSASLVASEFIELCDDGEFRSVTGNSLPLVEPIGFEESSEDDGWTSLDDQSRFQSTCWNWTDSLEFFAGLDGSKQPQDFGVNAQFGGRFHVNAAMPIAPERGLGFQVGTAVSQTHHAVAVTNAIEGSTRRTQSFTTVGIFQRTESGWTWGLVDDFLYQEDYDATTLMQLRGRVGYDLNGRDEVGVFGMAPVLGSDANWAGNAVQLRPLAQGSLFWRHDWEFGGQTTGWLGIAEQHGQANAALGDRADTGLVPVFGADLHLPLNDRWAVYGEANFVTPSDTGTVDAFLGFAYYPGGGAVLWRKQPFSPVLPVAGSPTMSVNLTR